MTTTTGRVDKLLQHPLTHDRIAAENRVKEDGREEEGESLSPSLEERRAVLGCGARCQATADSLKGNDVIHRGKTSAGDEERCCGSEDGRREGRIVGEQRRNSGDVCVLWCPAR